MVFVTYRKPFNKIKLLEGVKYEFTSYYGYFIFYYDNNPYIDVYSTFVQ